MSKREIIPRFSEVLLKYLIYMLCFALLYSKRQKRSVFLDYDRKKSYILHFTQKDRQAFVWLFPIMQKSDLKARSDLYDELCLKR